MLATTWERVIRNPRHEGDEVADRYDTLTNDWGYAEVHEFAFASKPDAEGNLWSHSFSACSYESHNLFPRLGRESHAGCRMIPCAADCAVPRRGANAQGVMLSRPRARGRGMAVAREASQTRGLLGHPRVTIGIPLRRM